MHYKRHPRGKYLLAGFTLIEALVSLAIISLMVAIVLFNHRAFEGNVILTNLVYEMALSIREAQVLSISVSGEGGSAPFSVSYGVHFEKADPITDTTSYILYADRNLNGVYDSGDAVVDTLELTRGHYISDACIDSSCFSSGRDTLDITFKRPRPDALFDGSGSSGSASIEVSSPGGEMKRVVVYTTGQISVDN